MSMDVLQCVISGEFSNFPNVKMLYCSLKTKKEKELGNFAWNLVCDHSSQSEYFRLDSNITMGSKPITLIKG